VREGRQRVVEELQVGTVQEDDRRSLAPVDLAEEGPVVQC